MDLWRPGLMPWSQFIFLQLICCCIVGIATELGRIIDALNQNAQFHRLRPDASGVVISTRWVSQCQIHSFPMALTLICQTHGQCGWFAVVITVNRNKSNFRVGRQYQGVAIRQIRCHINPATTRQLILPHTLGRSVRIIVNYGNTTKTAGGVAAPFDACLVVAGVIVPAGQQILYRLPFRIQIAFANRVQHGAFTVGPVVHINNLCFQINCLGTIATGTANLNRTPVRHKGTAGRNTAGGCFITRTLQAIFIVFNESHGQLTGLTMKIICGNETYLGTGVENPCLSIGNSYGTPCRTAIG